ncbi:MAG: rod shape-determining protein MreC [Lachnospiraceae bacterium]|nr:rod shape-determining protein MreC [Lachnospiraceae bacterium]
MKRRFRKFSIHIRSRYLLTVFVFVCIGLMLASSTLPGMISPVREISGYAVAPFQNGINQVGGWFRKQLSGFQSVQELSAANEELQAQIDALTEQNSELMQAQTELTRLEALYKLDQEYPEYNKVAAEVISKDPGNWYSTFTINKGTADGIRVDMNVLAQGGLIGIVTETGEHWATVRSIIDDANNISAMAANTSETCVVTGSLLNFESGRISFSGLSDPNDEVTEGSAIVTSNVSSQYLSGLLIGYVSDLSISSNKLTKSGYLIPVASFRSLREVLVITEVKQTKENSD